MIIVALQGFHPRETHKIYVDKHKCVWQWFEGANLHHVDFPRRHPSHIERVHLLSGSMLSTMREDQER